jgi:hypothetical protein
MALLTGFSSAGAGGLSRPAGGAVLPCRDGRHRIASYNVTINGGSAMAGYRPMPLSGKDDPGRRRVFDHPGLRVTAASPRYIFAMKAFAARTGDPGLRSTIIAFSSS